MNRLKHLRDTPWYKMNFLLKSCGNPTDVQPFALFAQCEGKRRGTEGLHKAPTNFQHEP